MCAEKKGFWSLRSFSSLSDLRKQFANLFPTFMNYSVKVSGAYLFITYISKKPITIVIIQFY